MSDFQVTIHTNRWPFGENFSEKVREDLVSEFDQAKGAYVVQGHFDSKFVSLDTRIARELWKRGKEYDSQYLIVVVPDASSNLQDTKFIVPDELMRRLIVVEDNYLSKVSYVVKGARMNYGGVQSFQGSNNNDKFSGGAPDKALKYDGKGGDDMIYGRNGMDMLRGGKGNDLLAGGIGSDWLLGGQDNDLYEIDQNDIVYDNDGGVISFGSLHTDFSPEKCVLTKDGQDLIVSDQKDLDRSGNSYFRVLDFFQNKERFTFVDRNALATGKRYKVNEVDGQYRLALAVK